MNSQNCFPPMQSTQEVAFRFAAPGRFARTWLAGVFTLTALVANVAQAEDSWTEFRGPNGTGISKTAKPPLSWSETVNGASDAIRAAAGSQAPLWL